MGRWTISHRRVRGAMGACGQGWERVGHGDGLGWTLRVVVVE